MPIEVACSCGKSLQVPDQLAGKKVKCPACETPLAVPASAVAAGDAPIRVRCECGKTLAVPARLAGKKIKCPGCEQPVSVPLGEPAREKSGQPASDGDDGLSDVDGVASLLDEANLKASATGRRCPDCRADMQPDDVICVNCGFNTETGRKLGTRRTGRKETSKPVGRFQANKTGGGKYAGLLKVVGALLLIGVAAILALRTAGIWP
jgi:hypothetical protein